MTILAERHTDGVDSDELLVGRRIQRFSQLAGPVTDPGPGPYRVSYRGVDAEHGRGRVVRSLIVAVLNFAFEIGFFVWLLHPTHRPPVDEDSTFVVVANAIVISSIALMELLRVVNVFSLSLASVISRDPVPVTPEAGGRVAFLTTIVPGKEPVEVVRGTLAAALQIQYEGLLDVWILDEGDDDEVKEMCAELGVLHFTRKGIERYNQRKGAYKAKTKHGNYNAWVAEHGDAYDVFLSVDPDHVPLPNYADRVLGYFRDPDVAYVVGPQCYANDETFVTRAAESQQFPFHSLIQRAANRYDAAMLVGTNNAVRISALREVGGLSDSITEDMATGLKFHARRNSASGARWKSVYTPDVLAVGEGPSSWGDFFSQQMRWSRGTFEVLLTDFWKRLPRLSPGRALHYVLITTFYPSMAIGWILGAVNAVLFLALGVQGIVVPVQLWLALYIDATAFQLWVYLRNRRYNVSPYEAEGSSGIKGMLMSIYAAPIFAASLIATVLRLPATFVVTPKGVSTSADHILTFRRHLQWATLLVAAIATSMALGYASPAVLLWPMVALLACLAPPALWIVERVVGRRPAITPEPVPGDGRSSLTTEALQRAALDALIAEGAVAPRRTEGEAREVPLVLGGARPGPAAWPLPSAPRVAAQPTVGSTVTPPPSLRPHARPVPLPGPRPVRPGAPGPVPPPVAPAAPAAATTPVPPPVAPAAATTPVPPRAVPPGTPPGPPPGVPPVFPGPAPAAPVAGRARPVPPGVRPVDPQAPPVPPAPADRAPERRAVVLRTRDAVAGPPPAGTPAAPGAVEPVAADGRGLNPVTGLPAAAATRSSAATRPVGAGPGRPVTPVSSGSRTGNGRSTGDDGPGAGRATRARSSGLSASTVAVRVVALAAVARSAPAEGPGPGPDCGRTETS